jgi:NDP-sugar pyrophosphorylase family protein
LGSRVQIEENTVIKASVLGQDVHIGLGAIVEESQVEESHLWDHVTVEPKSNVSSQGRRIQNTNDALVDAGLADVGDISRWSDEYMFQTKEALLGRKVDYDGNPHVLAEQGFQGNDPHAFRVWRRFVVDI